MRKKIALFISEIAGDFQRTFVKAIMRKANALKYDLVVFCAYGSYNDDLLYAEGEKAIISLPDCSTFDGIIVTEDLFDNPGMADELYDILKEKAQCPVVYLRSMRDEFYSILVENKKSIANMVKHFIDEHGFKDICYMSGKKGFLDTNERLQGYIDVMKENNIDVNEHMIFHGDFWRDKGKEAVDWFMEGREENDYPQAVVCANDYMAISICEELHKRGVRVPEDVCVSGFDCINEAMTFEPTLTTMQVDIEEMSAKAVEIIDNVNHGIVEDKVQYMEAKLLLYKSCGCGEQAKLNYAEMINDNYLQTAGMKRIMHSTIEYQDAFEFDEYMAVADKYRKCMPSDKILVCFKDKNEQGAREVENDNTFTSNVVLLRVFEGDYGRQLPNKVFPREQLLPKEFWDDNEPNNYLFFSLHFKNVVYGYLATSIPENGWFDVFAQAYLMTLDNAIANGDAHSRIEQLEEIRALYQKDALTGIYNRRGFDKLLRDRFALARLHKENIGIVSIDMDSLKEINDGLGHAYGDKAIKGLAEALESVMHEDEFCARIGGDEFAAVISRGDDPDASEKEFRSEFFAAIEDKNKEISEFDLEASVGIFATAEAGDSTLAACIQQADMRMYSEKRTKKVPR